MASSNALREEFQTLEHTIVRFIAGLVPAHQLEAALPEDKHILIVCHSLSQSALIHLYFRFGQDDSASYEKSLRAARSCISIIKHIADADFDFLDPIIGVMLLAIYICFCSDQLF
jgi:hypothetical protein